MFHCTAACSLPKEQLICETGIGETKKLAKRQAAIKILKELDKMANQQKVASDKIEEN